MDANLILIRKYAANILEIVRQIRRAKGAPNEHPLVLNAIWELQDWVHRLNANLQEHPESLEALRQASPHLVPAIYDSLGTAEGRPTRGLAAIQQACAAINRDLIELEHLKQTKAYQMVSA